VVCCLELLTVQHVLAHMYACRFGYVHFTTKEEAVEALKKKVEIQGRSLYLDMAVSNGMCSCCIACYQYLLSKDSRC